MTGTPQPLHGRLRPLVVTPRACAFPLAACESSCVTAGVGGVSNAVPQAEVVGSWSGTEVMSDGAWNGWAGDVIVTRNTWDLEQVPAIPTG